MALFVSVLRWIVAAMYAVAGLLAGVAERIRR